MSGTLSDIEGHLEVPFDESDPSYAKSFDLSDADSAKLFFQKFGFVVFRNIFTRDECESTRTAMWSIVEDSNPGFSSKDPSTWGSYKSAGKYGLSMRGPCFHPTIVNNRQNPNLIAALRTIVESDDVMVSHDRFTIYRATGPQIPNGEKFRTGDRNVHLDLNPWWWCEGADVVREGIETLKYEDEQDFIRENNQVVRTMGRHVQCVLNFLDNREEDGGTVLVPGFHRCVEEWCTSGPWSQEGEIPRGEDWLERRPMPWLNIPDSNTLLGRAQRVPMREGSVLLWDQTVVHGSAPNMGTEQCRMAQFLKAFPRSLSIREPRLRRRAKALKKAFISRGIDLEIVSDIGLMVFGLDCLGNNDDDCNH